MSDLRARVIKEINNQILYLINADKVNETPKVEIPDKELEKIFMENKLKIMSEMEVLKEGFLMIETI